MIDFDKLPSTARIWVYLSNRALTKDEQTLIITKGSDFLKSWSAHGDKLAAGITIKHNLLLILAVDENITEASGCSIDKSTAFIKELENNLQLSFLDWQNMAYKKNNQFIPVQRNKIADLITQGKLSGKSLLLNTNINTRFDLENNATYRLSESSFNHLLTPNR